MPLFTPPPRIPGPQLTALEATIRAWRRDKWLTGGAHAAKLGMLRHLADQLDRLTEQGKPTAPIARTYWDALDASSPPEAARADPRAAALTAAAESVLADLDTP